MRNEGFLLALQLYSPFPCPFDGYIKSKVSGLHTEGMAGEKLIKEKV